MKTKKRQKLCYNCEGEIDLDVIVCPFCAADLREERPERNNPIYDESTSMKNLNTQQSLYPSHYAQEEEPEAAMQEPKLAEVHTDEDEPKSIVGPTIMATLGAQLLLLSLLMLFFANDGVMTLKWDARFWFFYFVAAVPLLIFGYRGIEKL